MRVLVYDPSGNFAEREGRGTTGWAIFEGSILTDFGDVDAKQYVKAELYWGDVSNLIAEQGADTVVCESYKLFAHKSKQQHWSELETPQLIGHLRMTCHHLKVPIYFQDPTIKTRVADPILEYMGVIQKKGNSYTCRGRDTNLHQRDAIRHGVYWHRYSYDKLKEG